MRNNEKFDKAKVAKKKKEHEMKHEIKAMRGSDGFLEFEEIDPHGRTEKVHIATISIGRCKLASPNRKRLITDRWYKHSCMLRIGRKRVF